MRPGFDSLYPKQVTCLNCNKEIAVMPNRKGVITRSGLQILHETAERRLKQNFNPPRKEE